jgi:hypothetical protein
MEIRAGKFILYFGLFCIAVPIGIFVLYFTTKKEDTDPDVIYAVLLFCSLFLAFAAYFLLHYYNHRIILSKKSMVIQNELGRRKEIFWDDIDQVTFHKGFKMFVISSRKGKTWLSPVHYHFLNMVPDEKISASLKEYFGNP